MPFFENPSAKMRDMLLQTIPLSVFGIVLIHHPDLVLGVMSMARHPYWA